jgi:hypothetical protein
MNGGTREPSTELRSSPAGAYRLHSASSTGAVQRSNQRKIKPATESDYEEENGSWAMAAISERLNAPDEPRETRREAKTISTRRRGCGRKHGRPQVDKSTPTRRMNCRRGEKSHEGREPGRRRLRNLAREKEDRHTAVRLREERQRQP